MIPPNGCESHSSPPRALTDMCALQDILWITPFYFLLIFFILNISFHTHRWSAHTHETSYLDFYGIRQYQSISTCNPVYFVDLLFRAFGFGFCSKVVLDLIFFLMCKTSSGFSMIHIWLCFLLRHNFLSSGAVIPGGR